MNNKYFELARNEEIAGNDAAALLLYLSSFATVVIMASGIAPTVSLLKSGVCSTDLCSLIRNYLDWFTHTVLLRTLSARNF